MGERDAATQILGNSAVMQLCRDQHTDRYLHLESLLTRTHLDADLLYPGDECNDKKLQRRHELALDLSENIIRVPHGRLVSLLTDAMRWQHSQNMLPKDMQQYDIVRGVASVSSNNNNQADSAPNKLYATIQLLHATSGHVECAVFAHDGDYLITGSFDGMIQVWNYNTGNLRTDLDYQNNQQYMQMPDTVICLALNADSTVVVAGSKTGSVRVFDIQSGSMICAFDHAHSIGVASVQFSHGDNSQILSAGFDQLVRIHGRKSGRMIKEFRGHSSFVNCAVFSSNNQRVMSGSSDGTIKIWNPKTSECLQTITPMPVMSNNMGCAVQQMQRLPYASDQYLVCTQSNTLCTIDLNGSIGQVKYKLDSSDTEIIYACISPTGKYVYACGADNKIYSFNAKSGALDGSCWKVINQETDEDEGDVVGFQHHPTANVLAVYSDTGSSSVCKFTL